MSLHILEKLAQTNPDCEIWWDSSPLVYASWRKKVLASAPEGKRADWAAQLDRLFHPETVEQTGEMGFRGVTTNPPLSLQALQDDPAFWSYRIRHIAVGMAAPTVERV